MGEYGFQFTNYGPFGEDVFLDVSYFKATEKNPMVWIELGAGFGAWPLKVFEYVENPNHTTFIVSEKDGRNLIPLMKLREEAAKSSLNMSLKGTFNIVISDCVKLFDEPKFPTYVPNGADFISALSLVHYCSPKESSRCLRLQVRLLKRDLVFI